ncbi:MAG: FAD:protein FMN transferase [Planctomycetota bacterium]
MRTAALVRCVLRCVVLWAALAACGSDAVRSPTPVRMAGECMGTSWSAVVTLRPGEEYDDVVGLIQAELDAVDAALSTWKDDSDLSRLNRASVGDRVAASEHTVAVLRIANGMYEATGGVFDPSVGPLVALWGFSGYEVEREAPSDEAIEAALARIGWPSVEVGDDFVLLWRDEVEVDASAVAKGYGVDAAAEALVASGHAAFPLEVGGEMVLRGRNPDGVPWRVGVDDPLPPEGSDPLSPLNLAPRRPIARLAMESGAVATSGDYRNVRRIDGRLVSHAIDPRTGYPVEHTLASATVVAPTCAVADALATAALVLGPEDGLALLERLDGVEGYLLVRTEDPSEPLVARSTAGMPALLLDGLGKDPGVAARGR